MARESIHMLVALAVIVLVSGCVGGGGGQLYSMNDGAIIKDFSFDVRQIYDDEGATLSLTIENVGAKRIPGSTEVYIYGVPITTSESRDEWYVSDPGDFEVDDQKEYMTLSLKEEEFLPPDPEMNIPGTSKVFFVDMEAPDIPDGMTNTYTFYARLCFPYNTSAIAKVVVTSENELRYEGPPQTETSIRNSAGPIHISLVGSPTVRPSRSKIPLVFKITNVGGGFATLPSYACRVDPEVRERDKVKVSVNVNGNPADCDNNGIVRLRNGEGILHCTYTFTEGAPRTEHSVIATAQYNYYVTAQTEIEVMDSMTD